MNDNTKKMQNIELEILEEFKRICNKYSLRYFAIGGTCIGAVRHQGFIPWDDDIDVAMPFEDYKKFIKIASEELRDPYLLYVPSEHKYYQFNFMKIHDGNTFYIRKNYAPYPDRYTGIFFDIMPIYGMSGSKMMQVLCSMLCDLWLYSNKAIRLPYKYYSNSYVWKVIWCITAITAKGKHFNYYIDKIERVIGKYSFDNSYRIIFGWRKRPSILRKNYKYGNVFFYEDFADSIEVPFENTTIRIPKGFDRYLKMDFGDYMKMPPEEKRKSSHQTNSIIDLENSFRKYQTGELKVPV